MGQVRRQAESSVSVQEAVTAAPAVATTSTDISAPASQDSDLVECELLIEEVSIDGMCGVY